MIGIKRTEVVDILDKIQFFQGQRAGRELWNDKPVEVQEMDLESFNRDIRTIRDYILQLEEKATQPKVGEWIPCSERMPELDEGCESFKQSRCCLCAVKWWDGEIAEDIGWYNQTGVWNLDSDNRKVIAWMPLPDAFNAERGGKNE